MVSTGEVTITFVSHICTYVYPLRESASGVYFSEQVMKSYGLMWWSNIIIVFDWIQSQHTVLSISHIFISFLSFTFAFPLDISLSFSLSRAFGSFSLLEQSSRSLLLFHIFSSFIVALPLLLFHLLFSISISYSFLCSLGLFLVLVLSFIRFRLLRHLPFHTVFSFLNLFLSNCVRHGMQTNPNQIWVPFNVNCLKDEWEKKIVYTPRDTSNHSCQQTFGCLFVEKELLLLWSSVRSLKFGPFIEY